MENIFKLVEETPLGQYEFGAATNAVSFPDYSCLEFLKANWTRSNHLRLIYRNIHNLLAKLDYTGSKDYMAPTRDVAR